MSLSTRQPSIARTASSYKEEVLRTLHSQPNGQLTDDRVGISAALTETLQTSGLPVTAGTISSALGLLRREGRVVIEYGHRSLDNKLVFTSVTVLAEPLDGVATGPSRPVEHSERDTTRQTHDDLLLLRRILRLLQSQPAISDEDLERFQSHVEHLIDENETWEAIAQETEDALLAEVSDLHQRLTDAASEQATLLAQRDAEHAATVKSINAAARRDIEHAQSETATTKRDIASLQHDARWATDKIARLEKQKRKSESETSRAKEKIASTVDIAQRREESLIANCVYPAHMFVSALAHLCAYVFEIGDSSFSERAIRALSLAETGFSFEPQRLQAALQVMSAGLAIPDQLERLIDMVIDVNNAKALGLNTLSSRILDETVGPLTR
jgi:hypothetical protein